MKTNELIFSFPKMNSELLNFSKTSTKFLKKGNTSLEKLRIDLNIFKDSAKTEFIWEIPESSPIETILSEGKFETSGKGIPVYGSVCGIWEIKKVTYKGQLHFAVHGNASMKISIVHFDDAKGILDEIARWRFEIGSHDSPGCHFHAQIMGEKSDCMFPHDLSVPRLPSIIITPVDVLDYLLGELFQDNWHRLVSESSDQSVNQWSSIQKTRISNLIKWKSNIISSSDGSSWVAIKRAKPAAHIFVDLV